MNKMECFYVLNEKRGTFTQKRGEPDYILLIGGEEKKANILMGNFEVYCKIFTRKAEKSRLPDEIINLLQYDMETRLD